MKTLLLLTSLCGKVFCENDSSKIEFHYIQSAFPNSIYFQIAVTTTAIGFIIYLFAKNRKIIKKETMDFRQNVSLLRAEKLGTYNDVKLQEKRRKVLKNLNMEEDTVNLMFSKKAKKLGISTGDILLASKIQSSIKRLG